MFISKLHIICRSYFRLWLKLQFIALDHYYYYTVIASLIVVFRPIYASSLPI